MNIKRLLIALTCALPLFVAIPADAQTKPDYSNIDVSKLPEDQIRTQALKLKAAGFTLNDALEQAKLKGAPFSFSKRRKNSFSTQGNSLKIVRNSTMPDSSMRKANPQPTCPELCPSRSARSMSAAVSVIIVPPTVTATDTSFTTSILLAIG